MDKTCLQPQNDEVSPTEFSDTQVAAVLKNVVPRHPALRRVHHKLNGSSGFRTEAAITSYDRMHHRHNRS